MLKIWFILLTGLHFMIPNKLFSKDKIEIRESTIIYKLKDDATLIVIEIK